MGTSTFRILSNWKLNLLLNLNVLKLLFFNLKQTF